MPKFDMLSALAIAAEVQTGQLKPEQALALCEENIASHDADIQAFTSRPENLLAGKGPLAGISIGVKDIFDTHDLPTAYGSKVYANRQPATDASLVSMLRNAGATIAGKTVTTEFAWFQPGQTRNPHNLNHTPGGSSSGSAAGVAAGFFPAAIGSQTGGSVIRPAAFCGISGYKPSFRLFPTVGMKHFSWSLDTAGFFAASAADVAFVAAACSRRELAVNERDTTAPNIGLFTSAIDHLIEPDMAATIKQVTKWTNAETVRAPDTIEAAHDAHNCIQSYEAQLALADEYSRHREGLSLKLRDYLKDSTEIKPEDYDNARRTANRARKSSHGLFDTCDILLTPSAPGTAPKSLKSTGDPAFNRVWTLMGLPCVNIAGMTGENGLPLGMQLVGPFGKDREVLQAAHWLEKIIANRVGK